MKILFIFFITPFNMSEEVTWEGLMNSEEFARRYDDIRLEHFRDRNIISEDKISDWKKAGLIYYVFSLAFLSASFYLFFNLSSGTLGIFDKLNNISAIFIAIVSIVIALFKRQEFYEEDVSRSDLIYHKFAKVIDIYYDPEEGYSEIQENLKSIGRLSDLNAVLGGRTLPRDIRKGLSIYETYLGRADSNRKLGEFIEISFTDVMSHPINYLELSEEETYIETVRSYKEKTVRGKSLAKHVSEPLDRVFNKFSDLGKFEILAIILVVLSLVANYFGRNNLTSVGIILSLLLYFARE